MPLFGERVPVQASRSPGIPSPPRRGTFPTGLRHCHRAEPSYGIHGRISGVSGLPHLATTTTTFLPFGEDGRATRTRRWTRRIFLLLTTTSSDNFCCKQCSSNAFLFGRLVLAYQVCLTCRTPPGVLPARRTTYYATPSAPHAPPRTFTLPDRTCWTRASNAFFSTPLPSSQHELRGDNRAYLTSFCPSRSSTILSGDWVPFIICLPMPCSRAGMKDVGRTKAGWHATTFCLPPACFIQLLLLSLPNTPIAHANIAAGEHGRGGLLHPWYRRAGVKHRQIDVGSTRAYAFARVQRYAANCCVWTTRARSDLAAAWHARSAPSAAASHAFARRSSGVRQSTYAVCAVVRAVPSLVRALANAGTHLRPSWLCWRFHFAASAAHLSILRCHCAYYYNLPRIAFIPLHALAFAPAFISIASTYMTFHICLPPFHYITGMGLCQFCIP